MSNKIPGRSPANVPTQIPTDLDNSMELRKQDPLKKGAADAERAKKSQKAAQARAQLLNDADLPEKMPGLSAEPSALHNVIQAGLSSLAKANSWEATDNALGVLVKAMVGAGAASKSRDAAPAPATLSMEFQQLLRSQVQVSDAGQLAGLKKDATQLVQLATVALGMDGLEGLPRAKQEAQIEADVRAIHSALADVLKLPADTRANLLSTTQDVVELKANVLDRSAKALDAAGIDTRARLDALAGILRIVSGYAQG